ncbi:MAG TPA: oligoendopeptidase F [Candidatus Fimimonas gallinarum]|uniref:Oligopeptidase F n=1 Tax=Candidatus Fimimonas gallinarum TaxID=2840821 RepID=A0A9D1E2U9_9BACT|nr:oligoendopeptidase F [Candidatus Fimimonas gallinarum]
MAYTNRKDIPEKYKWNLGDIFATPADWEKTFEKLSAEYPTLASYKGKLADRNNLLEFLKRSDSFDVELGKLYCYAYMSYNEDSQDGEKQARYSRVYGLLTQYSAALSFVSPEISAIPDEQLESFINDPAFSDYDVSLKNILAGKAHILSPEEEKILANVGAFSGQFQEVFNRLDSGDIKFDEITVRGEKVKLGHGAYSTLLQDKDQSVRKLAFETYYKAYINVINTLAGLYEGSVKADVFRAKTRKFQSTMESALFYEQVDKKVYDNLIKCMHESFQPLHHYIALRKKLMGLETLNMYDLYVAIFEDADISCEYEEACELVKKGLAPLGEDYLKVVQQAFDNRWIDVYETPTKRSGAYSMGVAGVHPYMLLNYQKTTHDIFTIAHEMGHSMHTYYSEKAQPVAKADYKIFVAEVASTCNEVLLLKYLLSTVTDVKIKKYLLQYYLDMLRTTMYRQAMFAEFEQITHELVEKGQPLTAEVMCNEYLKLNKMYYGEAVHHNDEIKYEWARIPHFYRAFYVYKYSTGIISAVCIAEKILKEGESAVKNYKKFLSLGGSMDPVSELKVAGVDLTSEEPFKIVAKSFEDTLAQLEELCK